MRKGCAKKSSRIARACDRCQHRKLACDETTHSCEPCRKASTWCTTTDQLTKVPAYRGQYDFLERSFAKSWLEKQALRAWREGRNREMCGIENHDSETDSETARHLAWLEARSADPERPWDKEDEQANTTMARVIQDKRMAEIRATTSIAPANANVEGSPIPISSVSSTQQDMYPFAYSMRIEFPPSIDFPMVTDAGGPSGFDTGFHTHIDESPFDMDSYDFQGSQGTFDGNPSWNTE